MSRWTRLRLRPRALGWLAVALAVTYALALQAYTVARLAGEEHTLSAVVQQDHRTIASHTALLAEVRADEVRYCQAARASGNQQVIAIVCPGVPK